MDVKFLEQFYEKIILPKYGLVFSDVFKWKDHGKVGPDTYAHYLEDADGTEFVLLNEDFPNGDYMSDNLTHSTVPLVGDDNSDILRVTIGTDWIPNVSGYFTLYKEKNR